ncbi:MAG: OmpA family protein [Myxococcales bacterium]|nr:OmpA family protein [Myxococcales bacterium]
MAQALTPERGHPLGLAFRVEATLPTGQRGSYLSSGNLGLLPAVVVDRSFDWLLGVHFAASVGLRLQSAASSGNLDVGDEWEGRLAAGLKLPASLSFPLFAFVELMGRTSLASPFSDADETPFWGRFGLRAEWGGASTRHHTTAGVDGGSTRGYGSPDYRLFVGHVFERRIVDTDGDGIRDEDDECPTVPEDRDGIEDDDGCPEDDVDRDGVPDAADPCPTEPEDFDGHDDDDGCPDLDEDRDGVPDVDDACPSDPEDLDGFDDDDGCPEEDGDRDGVPDHLDECPNEKETINGVDDEDGCPDEGEPLVEVTSEKVTIDSTIQFAFDSADIDPSSHSLLDQVALTIKANPQLERIRVEGHTDERGPNAYNLRLSQARADSVMRYLVAQGVSQRRLESVGYGEERPLVEVTGEDAWALNRRVEFTIVDQVTEEPGLERTTPLP